MDDLGLCFESLLRVLTELLVDELSGEFGVSSSSNTLLNLLCEVCLSGLVDRSKSGGIAGVGLWGGVGTGDTLRLDAVDIGGTSEFAMTQCRPFPCGGNRMLGSDSL
jgi:hypothetical protein